MNDTPFLEYRSSIHQKLLAQIETLAEKAKELYAEIDAEQKKLSKKDTWNSTIRGNARDAIKSTWLDKLSPDQIRKIFYEEYFGGELILSDAERDYANRILNGEILPSNSSRYSGKSSWVDLLSTERLDSIFGNGYNGYYSGRKLTEEEIRRGKELLGKRQGARKQSSNNVSDSEIQARQENARNGQARGNDTRLSSSELGYASDEEQVETVEKLKRVHQLKKGKSQAAKNVRNANKNGRLWLNKNGRLARTESAYVPVENYTRSEANAVTRLFRLSGVDAVYLYDEEIFYSENNSGGLNDGLTVPFADGRLNDTPFLEYRSSITFCVYPDNTYKIQLFT